MAEVVLLAATGDSGPWTTVLAYAWVVLGVAGGLGFVIFVHELGHFLVAKACGVKCEKFYIGFDLFNLRICRFQWGETEYGIGILPLGGYVKMLGQDDDPRQAEIEAARCRVEAASAPQGARSAALAAGTAAEGLTPGATVEEPVRYELDPRSYPAKPVWARMAIISAGVTMNVIFGVLLAAWAYWLGVPETPALIGPTMPGTPAWINNLEPGTKVVAFGGGDPYEHYRFEDVKRNIIFNGSDRDLTIGVVTPDGQQRTVTMRPRSSAKDTSEFPTIGFLPPSKPLLAVSTEIPSHWRAVTDVPLKNNDRIIAIQGKPLDQKAVYDPQLDAILAQNPSQPLKLTIEREVAGEPESDPRKETLDVVVQPRSMRDAGLRMKIGPVVAVRIGSPAAKAGFRPGDVITKFNGGEVGDPLSLGQRLIPAAGQVTTYTFTVARPGDGGKTSEVELQATAELPKQYQKPFDLGGPAAIESIGLAFAVSLEVAAVEEESPASKEGLQPGDRLVSAQFAAAGPDMIAEEEKIFGDEIHQEIKLDEDANGWTRVHSLMQKLRPDTVLRLKVQRGKEFVSVKLVPQESKSFFDERRGLQLYSPVQITHQAESLSEAMYLGGREVKERMTEVVATIAQLINRRVSPKHLSGPVGIITAAGHFASQGLPSLLIFLTILSANLAVLNFLPIPVLDGGHMLFLAWEGVTRKPVNPNVQGYLSLAGLLLLLSLMVFATAMDFNRFFS